MAESELAMKLLKERCLECSICAIFFNSSLTVSIKALFLSRILSATLIREFFMLFFTLVISCIPLRKRFSNKACPIYPLSAHSLPFIFFRNLFCFNGSRSSTFPCVSMKLRISPLSLIIRCSLNPKNHPMEHFPRSARPSKVLWINIRWLRHTRNGVESTKLMPVQVTQQDFLDENSQLQQDFLLQFHKTIIGHTFREEVGQMLADIFLVIMLETPETSRVEQDQDDHDFRIAHPVRFVPVPMISVFNHIFSLYFGKFFAKIIRHTINLRNFSLWEHSGNRLNIIIEHYKFNAFIAMFLILKRIILSLISNSR